MSEPAEFELQEPAAAHENARSAWRYARPAHDYLHLGISRRTFFRWRDHGEALGDWPPFDDPAQLEAWYDRMMAAGRFKHRMPDSVREAIAAHLRDHTTPPTPSSSTFSMPPPATVAPAPPVTPPVENDDYIGLEHELAQLRDRVASLRCARDEAYQREERTEGDLLDKKHREAFSELTIAEKRAIEVLEKRGALISRAGVEADLAPRITGIVVGGIHFLEKIEPQLAAITDPDERRRRRRDLWIEHVGPLLAGKMVPDYLRRAPAEVWRACADWLAAQAPPALTLSAA